MLRITPLTARGTDRRSGAAVLDYLREAELRQTDYYRDESGAKLAQSEWFGKGAEALGLSGNVDHEVMVKLAGGFGPDGAKLVRNAGKVPTLVEKKNSRGESVLDKEGNPKKEWVGGHRVGADCTFNAPKSVSLLFAIAQGAERDEILEDMKAATKEALTYLESRVETKRGKAGCIREAVKGLVVSTHPHFGNRELEPHLHVHGLVYAVAERQDGTFGAIENEGLMQHQMAAGALFRMSLAARLAERGYGIERVIEKDADDRETGRGYFEVAGIGPAVCDAFSTRRKQILQYQEEHGGSAQAAALATRKRKDEPDFDALDQLWQTSLEAVREQHPGLLPKTAAELKGREPAPREPRTDSQMLDRLHTTKAYFQERDLIERLSIEHVGDASVADLPSLMEGFKARTGLVELNPRPAPTFFQLPGRAYTEANYASPEMVAQERSIKKRALARHHDSSVQINSLRIEEAAERFALKHGFAPSAQQIEVGKHVAESGGCCVIQGYAGSGKTVSSELWIDALQREGRVVLGASTSWDAARTLAETGIESVSTARLLSDLERGTTQFTNRHVLVLDEAGMVGTPTIAKLMQYTDDAGAKIVLIGDPLQLQPIAPGAGMQLAGEAVGKARLDEIRRQKTAADLETAALFYKVSKEEDITGVRDESRQRKLGTTIYDRLEQHGQIHSAETTLDAHNLAVQSFLDSPFPLEERVMLAGTRADVAVLGNAIRNGLQERGEIGADQATLRDAKAQGQLSDLPLTIGDRVRFTERHRDLDVVNGMRGTVEAVNEREDGTLDLAVRLRPGKEEEVGRLVRWNSASFRSLQHDYAGTIHKAQGQSIADVHAVLTPQQTDQQLALVSFTRSTRRFALYGSDEDLDALRASGRMGLTRLKENIADIGVKRTQPHPPLEDTPLGQRLRHALQRPQRSLSR